MHDDQQADECRRVPPHVAQKPSEGCRLRPGGLVTGTNRLRAAPASPLISESHARVDQGHEQIGTEDHEGDTEGEEQARFPG